MEFVNPERILPNPISRIEPPNQEGDVSPGQRGTSATLATPAEIIPRPIRWGEGQGEGFASSISASRRVSAV